MVYENDPLWKLRHALAGLGLALLLSVFAAAFIGRVLGDVFGGSGPEGYTARVIVYSLLLLHVVIGAGVLFAKVARYETRPVSAGRVLTWFLSLWLWPLLLFAAKKAPGAPPPAGG